jgi:hypothetical protein
MIIIIIIVCRCAKKEMLWPTKLLDLMVLMFFFALVIFSELIIKFVIRFARFLRILCENFRKATGMVARNHQCCMYD